MKSLLAQLGRLFSLRLVAIGLTFVQTVALTRVFGSEVFGYLSVGLSVSALLVLILSFGLDQVAMRDIAMTGIGRFALTERWRALRRLIFLLVAPVTGLVLLIGLGGIAFLDGMGGYRLPLAGVLLILPAILARKFVESIALGTKQVARSIIGSQIAYPTLLIAGAVGVWIGGVSATTTTITLAYALAGIGSFVVALVLTGPVLRQLRWSGQAEARQGATQQGPEQAPHSLIVSGGHFALVSLGFVLGQHIDVLLTGALSRPEDAALVRVASRVAEMAGLLRAIIVLQYKPLLAEAHGAADRVRQRQQIRSMTLLFSATGLPFALGLVIFAEPAMALFGPEFANGATALRLFVGGVFISLVMGPGSTLLALSGYERLASHNLLMMLAIQITLNLLLIPYYGATGCAVANMTALIFLSVRSCLQCSRMLGINPSLIGVLRHNRMS